MHVLDQDEKNMESFKSLVENHDIECNVDTSGKVQFTSTIIDKLYETDP